MTKRTKVTRKNLISQLGHGIAQLGGKLFKHWQIIFIASFVITVLGGSIIGAYLVDRAVAYVGLVIVIGYIVFLVRKKQKKKDDWS